MCAVDLLWILHVKASKKYAGRTSTCIFFHIEHITWHSVVREEETKFVQYIIAKRYPHYIQKCMTKNPEHDKHISCKVDKLSFMKLWGLLKDEFLYEVLYIFVKIRIIDKIACVINKFCALKSPKVKFVKLHLRIIDIKYKIF